MARIESVEDSDQYVLPVGEKGEVRRLLRQNVTRTSSRKRPQGKHEITRDCRVNNNYYSCRHI